MEVTSVPENSSTSVYQTASAWVNVKRAFLISVPYSPEEDDSERLNVDF